MNKINSDASPKDSPAATVSPAWVNESGKAERKHPDKRPKTAVRIGREKRDQPRNDIAMILYLGRIELLRVTWLT
jgi:hypothetical protein